LGAVKWEWNVQRDKRRYWGNRQDFRMTQGRQQPTLLA
jgi:hypothetical protein